MSAVRIRFGRLSMTISKKDFETVEKAEQILSDIGMLLTSAEVLPETLAYATTASDLLAKFRIHVQEAVELAAYNQRLSAAEREPEVKE